MPSTLAPTPYAWGPLDPCVERIEYHKAYMWKTMLMVGMGAFFAGICLCSVCLVIMWCISARIDFSLENGGMSHRFDGDTVINRLQNLSNILQPGGGEGGVAMPVRRRYDRVQSAEDDEGWVDEAPPHRSQPAGKPADPPRPAAPRPAAKKKSRAAASQAAAQPPAPPRNAPETV
ncbi:hypothetical protein M885DRAFT_575068 [Pelagophyceae sp. CCMP2097]|nr:hypothetical protein M885DRAFT_575068 [Pelagophyceae sp. CCMP2097]